MVDRTMKVQHAFRCGVMLLMCALTFNCAKQNNPPLEVKPTPEQQVESSQALPVTETSTAISTQRGSAVGKNSNGKSGSGSGSGSG
ncbi:MAG: hypothetical protein WCP80_09380, partial [Phycisphaerales bacterium]